MKSPDSRLTLREVRTRFDLSRALIVLPAECPGDAVADLRAAVRDAGGDPHRAMPAADLCAEDPPRSDLLAIGSLASNALIERLYRMRLCFLDAEYPGAGGHAVCSLANPFGTGRDAIVIGAGDPRSLHTAIRRFGRLIDRRGPQPGYVHDVVCGVGALNARARAGRNLAIRLRRLLADGDGKQATHVAVEQGLLYYLTGRAACRHVFVDHLLHYFHVGRHAGAYPGSMVYSWFWKAMIVWELLCCDPAISAADRRRITRGLWDVMVWLRDTYGGYLDHARLEIRHNHWTYHGLSLYLGLHHFRRHHGLAGWQRESRKIRRLFEGQCLSSKINDDAAGYAWQVPRHLLTWLNHQGRTEYYEAGHLRRLVDLAVAATDNMGAASGYGDCHGYSQRTALEPGVLGAARWVYREGWMDWLAAWRRDRLPADPFAGEGRELETYGWFAGRYATRSDSAAPCRPPDHHVGVFPLMLDAPAVDWVRTHHAVSRRTLPRRAAWFDKIAFRRSFDSDDEYLLLEGTSTFLHGHQDGNTIVRLTWNGRCWLIDDDYLRGMPDQHNGLTVIRDGRSGTPPPLTMMAQCVDLPSAACTHTISRDCGGGDWHRRIVWLKGRFFVVDDEFHVRTAGDYRLERRWRLLGDAGLRGDVLTCCQGSRRFHVGLVAPADRRIDHDTPDAPGRECDLSGYPYASDTIAVLKETDVGRWAPGTRRRLRALLCPTRPVAMRAVSGGVATFRLGRRDYVVADGRVRLPGDGRFDGQALIWGAERLAAFGLRSLHVGRLTIQADRPVDVEINVRAGTSCIVAPSPTTVTAQGLALRGTRQQTAPWSVEAGRRACAILLRPDTPPTSRPGPTPKRTRQARSRRLNGHWIASGSVTALRACDAGIAAGLADGRLLWIAPDGPGVWMRRTGEPVTAIFVRNAPTGPRVAAGTISGAIRLYDESGRLVGRARAPGRQRRRVVAITWAGPDDSPVLVAAIDHQGLVGFDPTGKMLWQAEVSHGPTPCLAAVDVTGSGQHLVVCGSNYHSSLWAFATDGTVVAAPWIRMDSTCQCMTCLEVADLDGDRWQEAVWGTLGHLVLSMPLPDSAGRAGPGGTGVSTIREARMGGPVLAVRCIEGAKGAPIVAVDACGHVAAFDGRLRRRRWRFAGDTAPVVAAGISAQGTSCLALADGRVRFVDAGPGSGPLRALDGAASRVAFCGRTTVLAGERGVFMTQDAPER